MCHLAVSGSVIPEETLRAHILLITWYVRGDICILILAYFDSSGLVNGSLPCAQ